MSIWQVLGFIGIGTVLGSSIQVFFNYQMQNKKLIFETRVKAYQGLVGGILNLFYPECKDKDSEENETFLNSILSEPLLLGSNELVSILTNFRNDFIDLFSGNKISDEQFSKEVINLQLYQDKIHKQMRKDLYIK